MFILPIIFLCNTALFVVLLEERFKFITTVSVSAIVYILSMVANSVVGGIFADPLTAGHVGNGICVLLLFLASVFISSNNLSHKVFVGLTLIANYAFFTDFVPHLLGSMPFGVAGIPAVLIGNGIYILLSLITVAFYSRPLHYFFRRGSSPSMIVLCGLQLLAWYIAKGGANRFFNTESFPLRFFLTLTVMLVVTFAFRSIYGGARYKARDVIQSTDDAVMNIEADSFNTMLVNVNNFKTLKKNLDYQLDRIGTLAEAGKTAEIQNYVELSKQNTATNPLLTDYSENPYINAILATKASLAKSKGVRLESNISLGETEMRPVELCVIINDILALAISETENAPEDKFVRLNVLPTDQQLTVEAVYTEGKEEDDSAPLPKRTVWSFLEPFFQQQNEEQDDGLRNIMDIIEKRSGRINIAHSDGSVIIRIGINY